MNELVTKATGGKLLYRTAALSRADGAEQFELSFSSEDPYERSFGMEILGHKSGEVRTDWIQSGHAPMLNQHDTDQQIGVVDKAWIADGKARALVRFATGALAQELLKDVLAGVRGNVSVGYMVHDMVLVSNVEGTPPTYRVTDWEPLEVSLVSLPADRTVGFGRQATTTNHQGIKIMNEPAVPQPTVADERARVADISAIGKAHKLDEIAQKAIADGASVADFRGIVLAELAKTHKPVAQVADLGLSGKEKSKYSLARAIRSMLPQERVDAGFEVECSQEIARRVGRAPQGLFLPTDVFMGAKPERRTLQIADAGTGSYVVATDMQAGNFIDLLRNRMVTAKLGVQTLPGLVGDVSIPKQSGGATLYWVAEGAAVDDSDQTFTQVTATPHTAGAATGITRKLLIQSTPSAEQLVRNDLLATLAVGLDKATMDGTGADGQPLGIFAAARSFTDVTVTAGTPTYAELLGFVAAVAGANADIGSMGWAITPLVWAKLAATFQNASAGDTSVLDWRTKTCLGFPYEMSMQVTAKYARFGVWSQAFLGLWNAPDLLVDPYTNAKSGTIIVRVLQECDVMVRHEAAFASADILS